MMIMEKPAVKVETRAAEALLEPPKMNSVTLEYYLRGLHYPAVKGEIIAHAEAGGAPGYVMDFFINRLPSRQFRSAADISFTVFVSSYMFGQD
ncbi:DUF2795 domain-containing protein [Dehalogenimonas alkenigignens]|uniref:Uncharacterized protein n=2 Tax=Dehalogenimonas alkenigignens TaxID=1217799 RepID=A0A0W0GIE0_9CHLR|nr:Protein of unknown function (DUF2795) [Dehalogenimonas alkenigignens]PVV82635.1 DUF2795 domain-containing protein [Dehalogenimonas alkenigignens]